MKGLLVKDLRLLMRQKNMLLLIVLFLLFFSRNGLEFTLGFFIMMVSMFGLNTISYDTMDNGMAYLMTMPAGRKLYALEKYILTLLPGIFAAALVIAIRLLASLVQKQPEELVVILVSSIAVFFAVSLVTAIYLPIQLKFEAEKARIIILMGFVGLAGCAYILMQYVDRLQGVFMMVEELFENMNKAVLCAGVLVVWMALMFISLLCSIHIMEKKEF